MSAEEVKRINQHVGRVHCGLGVVTVVWEGVVWGGGKVCLLSLSLFFLLVSVFLPRKDKNHYH